MPASWRDVGLADFQGRVLVRRRFGYPGRIDAFERVWLTFAEVVGTCDIRLNDQQLGHCEGGTVEFEVTQLLQARNRLEVVFDDVIGDGGLTGEVAMEVRCTAWLQNVRAEPIDSSRRWRVRGEVIGTCDRPLELYALYGQSTVAYVVCYAAETGQVFELDTDELPENGADSLHVELIHVSTVWYALEVRLGT